MFKKRRGKWLGGPRSPGHRAERVSQDPMASPRDSPGRTGVGCGDGHFPLVVWAGLTGFHRPLLAG